LIEVHLRDPDTMESFNARAIIRPSFEEYPDADRMFYVSPTSGRHPDPVPIEIVEIVQEETEEVEARPTQKLSLGQRRGTMLADMIREHGDKKRR